MKRYDTKDIRNIVIIGQRGAGKTSLAEAILFTAGRTTRLGSVDDETSTFDTEPEEIKRHSTIHTSMAFVEWKKKKINLLDTPGAADFNYDLRMAARVADGAVVLVSAPDGVQVGTQKAWKSIQERGIPSLVFISQMDRERASFADALESVQTSLSRLAAPLFVPIGKEQDFNGVVDLVTQKAHFFAEDGKAEREEDAPADLADEVAMYREKLVEIIAESDDSLMEKFFAEELSDDDLRSGLATAIAAGKLVPVLCGAGKRNIGIQPLLDLVVNHFPSPADSPPLVAKQGSESIDLKADSDAPFVGVVFKTVSADIGRVTMLRVAQGSLESDSTVINANKDSKERFGQLYLLQGKKRENVDKASAGDLVAVAKLKETRTGHTLCAEKTSVVVEPIEKPLSVTRYAVRPKSKSDEDKLGTRLNEVLEEDPTLSVDRDPDFGEMVVGGTGQIHIDTTVERMRRAGVEVEMSLPRIPYRESIRKPVGRTEGKHKKQTGGRGQFGVCYIEMEPLPVDVQDEDIQNLEWGGRFHFENAIFGGSIPRQWIPSVEKGVKDRMRKGVIAGYPVMNVRIRLVDGKYHDVDSSDFAFQLAGSKGFQAAVKNASPVLLEPIYMMDITVPDDCMGDIMGDITSKRGRPMGSENIGNTVVIRAQAPLAEIQRYAADLESMTSGRGSFTLVFDHYEEVPANLAEKIIAESKVELDED
ncbi:MAG: elongation factor G [Polyangia bacterium]|jgi:elongation factor G|nr:elongation factor G [Polyangia bacterium]